MRSVQIGPGPDQVSLQRDGLLKRGVRSTAIAAGPQQPPKASPMPPVAGPQLSQILKDYECKILTAAALERKLVQIFTTRPVSARQGGHIAQLSAPAMTIAPNAAPDALAAGLAERIHGGVTGADQKRGVAAGQASTTAHTPRRRG